MWKLKNEQRRKQFEERLQENIAGATAGWTGLSSIVIETARELCGESRGQRHRERKTWWWCEEIKEKRGKEKLGKKDHSTTTSSFLDVSGLSIPHTLPLLFPSLHYSTPSNLL